MKEKLKELQEFVNKMKSTSSLLEKKVIIDTIKDNKFVTKSLNYTYDPYKKYYVTSKNCKKNSAITGTIDIWHEEDLFYNLDMLNDRIVTGHEAIRVVNTMTDAFPEYKDLILSIIDRNLELRASSSVINKVIPDLIPTFDVALATKYEPKFCDFENERWLASRKLDGVRCIIRKENDKITAYSRQGNEFTTLQKVLDDVAKMPGNFVLDGEICLMDKYGNEDFQGIMKQIKRKDHTIANPNYIVFDYLTLEEFDNKVGDTKLSDRIKKAITNCWGVDNTLSVLEQNIVQDETNLGYQIEEAQRKGYEGIMLRKDVGYQGKRTKNLLKCKKFFDAEYEVLSVDFDIHRIIKEGKEVKERMLSQVYIEHKGHKVAVGSGFNQEQRLWYAGNYMNESIVGKTITVQYFEETKNQEGGISLRFPTIKHIFENGRNV